jgi:GNAT superfamily N-acetyltransferase
VGSLNRLAELTEDWRYFTERDGFKSSLALIMSDLVRLPYRHLKFYIIACSLQDPFPDWQPQIELLIRPLERDDLDLVRQRDRPSEARLDAQRLAQGDKGFVAFYNGQPVGYTWGSTDPLTRLERVHPKLKPGDVLFTDSYTYPAFRGRGVQTALTLARFNLFRDLGFGRAISTIEIHNKPSLAVWQKKLNGKTIGEIDFIRIGPIYRVRYF